MGRWDIFLENETMRIENRFLTKNKVKNSFGKTISEVILNKAGQLSQMEKLYHEIFDHNKGKILIDENLSAIILKSILIRELKNSIFYYALSKEPKALTTEVITKHFSKTQAWKIKKEIENYSKQYEVAKNFDLYNELESKYENEMKLLIKN